MDVFFFALHVKVSQKFVPLIFLLIRQHSWSFKEMFIALSSTCIQNVSYRYSPFDCLFITFFKDVAAWSGISHVACRAPDDPFWAFFFTWYAVATSTPNNIFFQIRQRKKTGHSSKKAFPQWGFCTSLQIWQKLSVAWRTEHSYILPS